MNQQFKSLLVNGSLAMLAVLSVTYAIAELKHFRSGGEAGARVWFYDQAAKRLYAAPHDLIPPDGADEARVRAIVVGFQGLGNEVSQLKIAYLEKYSPEFKAFLQRAAEAHAAKRPFAEKSPSQASTYSRDNTLVKRLGEESWHTLASDEARQIKTEWRAWRGPAGQAPIISVPSIQ